MNTKSVTFIKYRHNKDFAKTKLRSFVTFSVFLNKYLNAITAICSDKVKVA